MPTWPKDTTAAKNAFYGDFHSAAWQEHNLVRLVPPFKMYYDKKLLSKGILVHIKIVDALTAVFNEVWEKCGKDQAKLDKTGISDFGGSLPAALAAITAGHFEYLANLFK